MFGLATIIKFFNIKEKNIWRIETRRYVIKKDTFGIKKIVKETSKE